MNKTKKNKQNNKKKNFKNRSLKKGGNWWSFFSNTPNSETVYDKYISKYQKQINDLNLAIKVLENKIEKMKIAKQSDLNIQNEKEKLIELNKEKNNALNSATNDGWFSKFFK
jgi:ATP-dependent protease HslVU (ClpYQ) ATPase subunit